MSFSARPPSVLLVNIKKHLCHYYVHARVEEQCIKHERNTSAGSRADSRTYSFHSNLTSGAAYYNNTSTCIRESLMSSRQGQDPPSRSRQKLVIRTYICVHNYNFSIFFCTKWQRQMQRHACPSPLLSLNSNKRNSSKKERKKLRPRFHSPLLRLHLVQITPSRKRALLPLLPMHLHLHLLRFPHDPAHHHHHHHLLLLLSLPNSNQSYVVTH